MTGDGPRAGLGCPPQPGFFYAPKALSPLCLRVSEPTEQPAIPPPRLVFRRAHRLGGEREFGAVFGAGLRKSRGPLTVFLRPSASAEHRLGLSVGRRFGHAPARARFKRMVREVFRHQRPTLARPGGGGGYDIVVTARSHEAMTLERYTELFLGAFDAAHRAHAKREAR